MAFFKSGDKVRLQPICKKSKIKTTKTRADCKVVVTVNTAFRLTTAL